MDYKKVLWLGVTPLYPDSERSRTLAKYLGRFDVAYPNETGGMKDYDYYGSIASQFEAILTDQSVIDESWEEFFNEDNSGKRIIKCEGTTWSDLQPGFSKEQKHNGSK